MTSSFDFTIDETTKRRAFRAQVKGLEAFIREQGPTVLIKDISATGFAFTASPSPVDEGENFSIDLLVNKRVYISEIPCVVVRVLDNGIVGCDFIELDRRQEARLDKLVLEIQKRMIAKQRSDHE